MLSKVSENLVDDRLILNAGNHSGFTAAFLADRHIDIEDPFEALCPSHGPMALFWCFILIFLPDMSSAAFGRRYIDTVFAVRREHAVEPGQIHPRLGHQRRQFSDEIQRIEDDMGGAIVVGRLTSLM